MNERTAGTHLSTGSNLKAAYPSMMMSEVLAAGHAKRISLMSMATPLLQRCGHFCTCLSASEKSGDLELGGWPSSKEHLLLLQSSRIQIPAPTPGSTTTCNFQLLGIWRPLEASSCRHSRMHTDKNQSFLKNKREERKLDNLPKKYKSILKEHS